MNKLVIFAIACAIASSVHINEELKPIIEEINASGTTWTAGYNDYNEGFTMDHIKTLLGALPENVHEKLPQMVHDNSIEVPASFDAREQWPNCESVQEIRDQSACGSCWAFGAAEAMSDRLCIASGQKDQTRISSEDLLSCCSSCGSGCGGGYPSAAWSYYSSTGLVSGDLYEDTKGCQPYKFPACAHHVHSSEYPDCPTSEYSTPSCSNQCQSSSGLNYNSDKRRGGSSYSIQGISNIQQEIYKNGPIEVAFTVYSDFTAYTSGVYQHQSGSYLGGHAVKMLGWGTENGTPYWLIANSWNPSWGDHGYFKILRGSDECGIEDSAVAGSAPTSGFLQY